MAEQHDRDERAFLEQEITRLRRLLNAVSSPLDVVLKRRGFQVFAKEPAEDLLIPAGAFIDGYYRMLHKYSFRLFLRDAIKHQDFLTPESVTRYATREVTEEYLSYIEKIGLAQRRGTGCRLSRRPVKSFGETLEWYVAEVFRRELSAEALWGVKFKRQKTGGDYDVIARLDCLICYVEVKSSPPKQIYDSEIGAFLDRVSDLSPEIAIFLMDTELRMKDKIVPMFEAALGKRPGAPLKVERLEKELFQIPQRIFIINAKDSIPGNIQKVLTSYFRGQHGI